MTRPLTKLGLGLLLIALVGGLVPADAANTVKHGFVCAKPDPTDVTLVNCTRWNAEHAFAGGATDQVLVWDAAQSDKVRWTNVPPFSVAKAGDTMTGALTLPADPTTALHAATKQYVDAKSGAQIIRKTADETVNNSTTLQNDDVLLVAIAVNETVYFECWLRHVGDSTADLKLTFTAPAGATGVWGLSNAILSTGDIVAGPGGLAFGTAQSVGAEITERTLKISGVIVNGLTAGNLTLQWAQDTAKILDTKVLSNSFLMVWRR